MRQKNKPQWGDFYPRSPRGERPVPTQKGNHLIVFLPALPARGATMPLPSRWTMQLISTRAPREGSDRPWTLRCAAARRFLPALPARGATIVHCFYYFCSSDFYPRSPRGERRHVGFFSRQQGIFLPALPARGATRGCNFDLRHAFYFYPRSPRGERPARPL